MGKQAHMWETQNFVGNETECGKIKHVENETECGMEMRQNLENETEFGNLVKTIFYSAHFRKHFFLSFEKGPIRIIMIAFAIYC